MEERESVVVSGCEGGGGGGGGAGEAKEYSVSSAAPLSPTRSLPPALSSGVVGAMGITVPPTEGAGLAMGMLGSGGSSGGEGDLFARKKRGRPRKYGPDGMALALSPTSGSASPFSPASSDGKRGRGRPPGSGKRQLLEALGDWFAHSAGGSFTPHVVTIATGEDVAAKIHSFSQKGPRAICILSANGVISNVTLRQPGSSGGTLTYEGRFEILSLSGSFTITETGGIRSRTGGISVSLAGPDGRVIGGGVTGLLLAASPIQVVVGSFMPNTFKEQKPKPSQQADFSAFPETSGLLTAARPISQSNPEDDCETSTSSLPGQSHAENSLCNPTPTSTLHAAGWQGLQSSEHKPSPDINICLHGEQHQGTYL